MHLKMSRFRPRMNTDYLRSIAGIVNVLQVLFGISGLLASCLIWQNSTIAWYIYYGYGFELQILVVFFMFCIWMYALLNLMFNLIGRDLIGAIGKMKVIICIVVVLAVNLAAAILEAYLAHKTHEPRWITVYKGRFTACAVFLFLTLITHIVELVCVILFG